MYSGLVPQAVDATRNGERRGCAEIALIDFRIIADAAYDPRRPVQRAFGLRFAGLRNAYSKSRRHTSKTASLCCEGHG